MGRAVVAKLPVFVNDARVLPALVREVRLVLLALLGLEQEDCSHHGLVGLVAHTDDTVYACVRVSDK